MLISACTVVVAEVDDSKEEEVELQASAKRITPDLAKTSSSNLTQVSLHKITKESLRERGVKLNELSKIMFQNYTARGRCCSFCR